MRVALRATFLSLFLCIANCAADTVISFEPPLPSGLTPMSFWEDTAVPSQARITNQYSNLGVLMTNVALVNLGVGQATSGSNGIAGISSSGNLDYGSPVTFTFVDPLNNTSPAVTDHFAISTDRSGGSGNTTTVSGYDINGNLLGSVSHLDTGGITLELQGVGNIHSVVAGSTLINHSSGGVALDDVRFGLVSSSILSQPVIGGSHFCTNASIVGGYGYAISGLIAQSGGFFPFADAGSFISDGNGKFNASDTVSEGGQITPRTLTGTYTVHSDCTGFATFTNSSGNSLHINIVIVDNGREINFIQTDSGAVVSGAAKQQQSGCTAETISGPYGFAVRGWYYDSNSAAQGFADSGKLVSDSSGNLSLNYTVSQAGIIATLNVSGTYTIKPDCTGSAIFTDGQVNTAHVNFVVVDAGREIQFVQTDSGTTISGSAKRLFALPSDAIVNAANFSPSGVVPGSLFSIFGHQLATGQAQARSLPLPSQLGGASVKVNGLPAPLIYASPEQINAQMPLGVLPGPAQLTVSVGDATSQPAAFTVAKAGPGVFTYGQNRAVVVNRNGKVNSAAAPAHVGEVVVAYLTGGGPVKASGPWATGAGSPPGPSAATLPVTITVGNQPAGVSYLGLTPGFVGLYQANFKIPSVPSGDHLLTVSVGGQDSDASVVSVVQ